MIKPFLLSLIITLTFASCTNKPGDTTEERLRTENFELRQQNDSLRNLINRSSRKFEGDTVLTLPDSKPANSNSGLTGKHPLTLQWISWDKPGNVTIIPAENGWYTITGKQENNQNYLKINGRLRPLNAKELEFEGEIETRIESINNNEPCLKTGKKLFRATGERKYWRLQDMINCDSTTTDYIDIYF